MKWLFTSIILAGSFAITGCAGFGESLSGGAHSVSSALDGVVAKNIGDAITSAGLPDIIGIVRATAGLVEGLASDDSAKTTAEKIATVAGRTEEISRGIADAAKMVDRLANAGDHFDATSLLGLAGLAGAGGLLGRRRKNENGAA